MSYLDLSFDRWNKFEFFTVLGQEMCCCDLPAPGEGDTVRCML